MPVKGGYTYILSNKTRSTLYIGVTSNLASRIYQHRNKLGSKFTSKYKCTDLIYYEFYDSIEEAIIREKRLKSWKREWKIRLIKKMNPNFIDLHKEVGEMK